jgi:hypothetical protein
MCGLQAGVQRFFNTRSAELLKTSDIVQSAKDNVYRQQWTVSNGPDELRSRIEIFAKTLQQPGSR